MNSEIIYLRGQSEEHRELINAFVASGFKPTIVRLFGDLLKRFVANVPRAVVIDASTNDQEVADRVAEISTTSNLFQVPVIFFGRNVVERTKELVPLYGNFIPVDYPFRLGTILARFNAVDEESRDGVVADGLKLSSLDPTKLEGSFGGLVLANGEAVTDFNDQLLIPEHPQKEKIKRALDDITARNPWLGLHARRTSFVTAAMVNNLSFLPAYQSSARTASLLLNWSLADADQDRVRLDFLSNPNSTERSAVSEAFKLSADLVAQRTGDERAAQVIRAVAALAGNKQPQVDPQARKAAEGVYLFEIAGRACWKNGIWENQGAHKVLRALRQNTARCESDVRAGVARTLGEAVATAKKSRSVFIKVMPSEQREAQKGEVTLAFERAKGLFEQSETRQVKVFELREGMRLAAPLIAADGQLVLPANTVLDLDILLRLFQLSAVRPIVGSVLVIEP